MHFNVAFVTTALLAFASPVMSATSATFTFFEGVDCTGASLGSISIPSGECFSPTNGGSVKSISYSGVPNEVSFYLSGSQNDICSNGAYLTLGGGSGCVTAPAGRDFDSVLFF